MKKLSILSLFFVFGHLVLTASVGSFAPECCPQIYIAASGGVSFHNDTKTSKTSASHDTGFEGVASIGYIVSRWRMELEGSFRRYSNDKVTIDGAATNNSGHIKEKALLLNAFYDISLDCRFQFPTTVYLGVGAGICRSELAVQGNCSSDNVLAWQLIAGAACDLSQYWAVTFGYRFFATAKPTYDKHKVSSFPYSNNIDLGLRLSF